MRNNYYLTDCCHRKHTHGCVQGNDHWYLTERTDLHSSPAIRRVVARTLDMAEKTLADVFAFDFYSCFPSAVEIACQVGLCEDDRRDRVRTYHSERLLRDQARGSAPRIGRAANSSIQHLEEQDLLSLNGVVLHKDGHNCFIA